jgi:protein-disulfide isomerase
MSPGGNLVKVNHVLKTVAIACIAAFSVNAASAANSMSSTQKQQVEGVVHDYLVKNPDVVIQALQTYQQKQMDQARKTMEKTQLNAPKFAQDLFHDAASPSIGNPTGKVTVVEFFDYQCPHCTEMAPVMDSLIKSNPDVRIVFKEFPIRGPASEAAAKAALAANMQGKYFELHKALMASHKVLTEEDIMQIAKTVGLNVDKLKTDMSSDAVSKQLKANYKLAQSLELMGTPAIFVAKSDVTDKSPSAAVTFIPGQVDQAQLDSVVKKISG